MAHIFTILPSLSDLRRPLLLVSQVDGEYSTLRLPRRRLRLWSFN